MLEGYSQRKSEQLEHLAEQVQYLLRSLRSYCCSDLIVPRTGWYVRNGDLLCNTLCCLHYSVMVLRVDQYLRVGGKLQSLECQLPGCTGRDAFDEFIREGLVHHCSDDSDTWHGTRLLQCNYYDNFSLGHKKSRLCRRVEWQRPIFPGGCPPSIVGAEGLNGRVRDGNGCFPFAIVTTPPACTCG